MKNSLFLLLLSLQLYSDPIKAQSTIISLSRCKDNCQNYAKTSSVLIACQNSCEIFEGSDIGYLFAQSAVLE